MSDPQTGGARRRQIGEAVVVLFFLALAGLVFQQTRTSFAEQGAAEGGAMFNAAMFPELAAWCLVLLAALRLVGIARTLAAGDGALAAEEGQEHPVEWSSRRRALVCLAMFVLYLVLLKPFGYHLTTPLFMFACFYVLGTRRIALAAVLAVGTSLFMSFVFEYWMSVIFPVGMFGIGF